MGTFKPDDDEQQSPVPGIDQDKLAAYANHLDNYDPRAAIAAKLGKMNEDSGKAMEIASRSPFADKTPEEQAFEEKNLDPMTRGLIQGGMAGTVGKVSQVAEAAPGYFGKIKAAMQGAAPAIDAMSGQAIPNTGNFINTAAKLEASHPAMINNRNIINNMVDQLGVNHPDVSALQQAYNKMLK